MEVDPIFQEFTDVLSRAAVAHAMAISGIRRMHEYWTDQLLNARPPTTASSVVNLSTGDPRDEGSITYSEWRLEISPPNSRRRAP